MGKLTKFSIGFLVMADISLLAMVGFFLYRQDAIDIALHDYERAIEDILHDHQQSVGVALHEHQNAVDTALHVISRQIVALPAQGPASARVADLDELSGATASIDEGRRQLAARDIRAAGIYFRNALGHAVAENGVLEKYVDIVLDWASKQSDSGDYESALTLLADLQVIVSDRAATVPFKDITKLIAISQKVETRRASIELRQASVAQTTERQALNKAKDDARKLLFRPLPSQIEDLASYINDLTALRDAIGASSVDVGKDKDEILAMISATLKKAEARRDGLVAVGKLAAVLGLVAAETPPSSFSERTLLSAESDAQVLAHTEEAADPEVSIRLRTITADIQKAQKKLTERNNDVVWGTTEKERSAIVDMISKIEIGLTGDGFGSGVAVHEKLEELTSLRQSVAQKLFGLTDQGKIDELKALFARVDRVAGALQREETRLYDVWAIGKVKQLHELLKDESDIVKDTMHWNSDKIRTIALNNLIDIDTRFLSLPVARAYSDVFDSVMKALNTEDRISLDTALAVSKKKLPGDV